MVITFKRLIIVYYPRFIVLHWGLLCEN